MIALERHGLGVEDDVDAILDRFPPIGPGKDWRLADPYPVVDGGLNPRLSGGGAENWHKICRRTLGGQSAGR